MPWTEAALGEGLQIGALFLMNVWTVSYRDNVTFVTDARKTLPDNIPDIPILSCKYTFVFNFPKFICNVTPVFNIIYTLQYAKRLCALVSSTMKGHTLL